MTDFGPRDAYAQRGLCHRNMSLCPSVCLSVRHTPVLWLITPLIDTARIVVAAAAIAKCDFD